MLTLEEYRAIYPEDAGLTDFEVTEKFRQARYPHMDAAAFAAQFGGPTQEDPVELAARNYNRANPDSPITAQDIRDKDRSGPLGYLRLLGEGIFDAVTDQLPEDMARIVRAGDISPEQRGTADEIIARQQRDSSRRIPSRQEAEGSTLATSLYQGPRSVATSMATGIGGMALGGAAGTVFPGVGTALGSMAGAGALSGAAFYRMAKDQFVEEMQRAGMARLGRPLSQEEAERLNAAIDDEATRFGLWEAGPEAVSQFFTAGLLGGAGGKILQKIGLGSLGEAIGKRAITRIPAKLGAEVGEEESTEGITFMGQEGIRQDMGLRPDAPTVSEFLKEQAGPVAVGALLQMGGMRGAQYLKDRYDARRQARELERQLADTEAVASEAMPKTADTPPLSNFDTSLGGPEWNPPAPRFDEAAWNREASERGWQHLRSDASEITAGQPPSPAADVTETSLALDAGKPLDLLAPPSPETPATPPVARQEPVAMPDMPRPAAAQPAVPPVPETAQSRLPDPQNNDGILARLGRPDAAAPQLPRPASPIAAPASGIELPSSPAQPVSSARPSARVPSLPTQAQLTRTQEAPRADTTAQAQALRLPAPEALPREAQTPTAPPPPPAAPMQPIPAAPSAPAMQPTPPPAPTQTTAGPPPSLPTPAPQPTAGPVLPPAEPVAIPQELAGLSRKEMIQRLPRQLRSKADFMGTEEMRSLLARRHAATQASTPPATREKRERQEPTQADKTGEEAPPTYYGKPISRPPIGDARREEAANRILAGAAARARAAGHQDMSAAVEALQREREMVGVTHDALWNRIIRDIQPYADEGMESDAARLPAGSTVTREGRAAEADSERTSLQGSDAAETADRQQEEKARPRIVIKSLVSGKEEYLDAAGSSPQSRNDEGHTRPAGTEATDKDASAEAVSPSGRYGTVAAPDTVALAGHFAKIFLDGSGFGTIVEARREASTLVGGAVRPATEAAKAVDEAVELGVTLAARRMVSDMRKRQASDTDIYRALVDLYRRQPRLSVRTSTSIAQQAYSTPAPLAFLASRLAGIHEKTRVLEPTAGNGMLLLEASPGSTVANELNPDRAARLRSQGFDVTERDAVDFRPEDPVDVVIANPPFGRVKDADRRTREFSVNGLTTKELDHAIVARALESLKQGGRAVLIIGGKQGNDAGRSKKYRAADQVRFWGWLFDRYRVLEHFSVDGKLYERQGAGYPIDIIVIENSGPSRDRAFPGAALPRVYTSFTALEEVLHGQVVDTAERKSGSDGSDTGRTEDGANQQRGRSDRPADAARTETDRGSVRSGGNAGTDGARSGERLDSGVRDDRPATSGGSRLRGSERPAPESGNDVSAVAEGGRAGRTGQADVAADSQHGDAGKRSGRDDAGGLGEHRDSGDVRPELGLTPPQRTEKKTAAGRPKSTAFQVAYEPASAMQGMGTLVPRNMATAARQALTEIERRHGSIDRYVAGQLGYPEKDLGRYFAAEQVDALGMAISNIADGSGFIIGDQTGIGKGRVNAGIIRWAKRQGYVPVFITMKPDLYADMVRDLADIGMEGFNPLPTNADLSRDSAIQLPDGRTLKTRTAKAHEKVLADVMQNGMGAYDAVFTTYDQLNPVKGKDTFRRSFLMDIAPNAVFILDESHNAGGQAATRKKASDADDRAQFVRKMLKASHQGAFYSSATYAKRPDVMSLYFKTDMQYAADDMGKLAEAIERGGIPMQQAVAAELTETGQYLRRERSFEGAEVQTTTVPIDKTRAEKTADIMRAIMAFDAKKEAAVDRVDKEAARRGGSVGDNKSTGKGGASSTNFTAVMHNVIAQSLLAQKVDAVVEAAAEDIARGEKVVIALSNTMGSMIREFAEQNGIAAGAPINFTFNDMFIRYLEKSRMISIREAGKKEASEKRRLTDEELGPDGVRAYNHALEVIRQSDFGGLQVSVIDRMLAEFEARGIRADEITGRTERIDYTTDVPTYARRTTGPSDRIRVVDAFNSGKLDVVILNQAGSTGISLHSSERFKDQRRRNMIIAQAESNIDVFMQTLGRVFRTGQVIPPTYQLIMSDLPAEKRPAAVLAKKMASLNANTTASKNSDTSFRNIPDFLNKYGDKVAAQVMADNPELSLALGSPVGEGSEDAMRKVTGRIPLLPVKEQEKLYALLESEYNDYIAQLEAMGGSGLEAKSLPLDARLLDELELVPAKDVGKATPFAAAARLGTYDVKKLGRPWPSAKVKEMVAAAEVPDMEKLRADAVAWHRKKAGEMSAEAAEKQLDRLNAAYAVITDAARMRPGTPVLITGNNTVMEGILIRLHRKGTADNPLALGAWKLDIALPDASRKITIPLSQTIRQDDAFTVTESHRKPGELYALFDSGQKESREKVHIITGNILAAFQKIDGKGNVITFQDHEGNTIPGILLPRDADPQKILGEMDVSLSPEAALQFLRELPGKSLVRTADKLLSLSHDGTDFTIAVPSSRARGAQFFLNGAVLEAAGKDFIRSGQSMVLRRLSADQALGIMQALSAQGYGFVADNNRDVARRLMASPEQQVMASLASRPVRRPDSRDAVKPSRPEAVGTPSVQVAGQFLPPRFKGRRAPTVAAVRRLAEKMHGMAVNAAHVQVVETVADLPANFREAYTSQTSRIEGMYDPSTDTVWLVAENLESLERAAEVWLHENMVHHGLRSALDAAQRRLLLNRLWLGMGGMMNADIRDIARRYGGDPRGNEADRMLVMEEALAKMAERRARGLLRSAQEQSLWRRFVDAVVRAWNNMVHSLTGRKGRMNRSRMEQLLDALQEHVMNGMPVAAMETRGNEQDRTSLASLGETQEEAAHTAWRQLQEDMAAWGRQVDGFIASSQTRKLLDVCRTPDVLRKLGAPDLPMTMTAQNLAKVLSDKPDHQLPKTLVKQLPAALAEPVMVFESATAADSFVVLTELKHEGRSVMVAVHLNTERQRIRVNDIASAYKRGNERWYLQQIEEGRLLYQDKKKSLAWARTNRLQLPQVRKLPARLSGNRILTDKDVVKPEAPSGEAPLASLRAPSVSLTERANAVVRRLRKIAGRGVSEDVEALLRDPEQGRLIPREDLGKMERLLKLPHWVAKDHPGFAAIYNRQLRRVDERRTAVLAATQRAPLLFDTDAGKRLNADEEQRLAAMIWKWDGKEIGPLHGIEKFIVTGTSLNGREELALNPRYQEKFRAWLREQPEPERVKEAFAQVRSLLDESFLHAYGRMTQMADLADTDLEMFRTEMGNLPNYFPHQRKGKYYVEATAVGPDGKRELVYRQHFDVPLGSSVREEWAKIVEANKKDYPGATWHNPKEVVQLPDDILGAPIDPQAMEQLINTTVQRRIKDGEQAEEVRKALLSGLADVLKARGFGAHAIQRKNIPGFEKEDVKGILYNYISGLHGWLSKMDASADFAQALGKISAQKSPELWSFASQYVRDMLRNTDNIDRIAGNIKTAAFVWYLGGNIKTAVVNSTQNLIVGVPRLQQEVTGGGALWLKAAMDTLGLRFSGKGIAGAKKLTADELRMLEELYGAGVIADAHMDEIRGQMARSPALRMWERLVRVLGLPMSIVEHFNRASLALAAYRAARAGRLSTSACRRLGIREGEKLSHDAARDFADMLVRDTHFEYGKGNAPELLRSTTAGRMLSPAFVFRSFSGNIINLWWRALRHEGREGRVFVAKSLGATVALGGLTAFPFYATLSALCTALSGDDEDWTTKVRRRLPESNLLRDVVCYGLPSLGGVTIGGSLRMETPFTEGIEKGTTFKDIMTQSLVSLIGVPYDLTVNKVSRALEAHSYGADDRALEALVPTFMANIMQAYRLSTEGQTTLRGRPINSPGQQGARKLDAYEAVGKALGFQPTSSAKSYAAYKGDQLRTTVRSELIDDFTVQALKDLESKGRPYMMRELRKRLQTWNAAREAEGKTGMKIMPKDVLRRVASRRRENSQSQKQRAKGAAQMALWGV